MGCCCCKSGQSVLNRFRTEKTLFTRNLSDRKMGSMVRNNRFSRFPPTTFGHLWAKRMRSALLSTRYFYIAELQVDGQICRGDHLYNLQTHCLMSHILGSRWWLLKTDSTLHTINAVINARAFIRNPAEQR